MEIERKSTILIIPRNLKIIKRERHLVVPRQCYTNSD